MTSIVFQYVYFLTTALFLVSLVRNAVFWTFLWQNKEYRIDRMFIHFRETGQGRSIFIGIESWLKNFLIIFFFLAIFNQELYRVFPLLVLGVYSLTAIKVIWEIKNKKIRSPLITPKIVVIIFLSFAITSVLYTIPILDYYFWLLFLEHFLTITIAVLFMLFSIPSDFYKDTLINKAIKKRAQYKNVTVIGITGSYGKGSVKEFLYTTLSHKFNVLKTASTYNTPIGIARTILSGLDAKKRIFIVEMGAYKTGDITFMSHMVKPKMGIITAVNDQHVSLFGSIDKIKKSKYELVESLPKDGIALFNGNNEVTHKFYQKCKKKKILYFADYNNLGIRADLRAFDIKENKFSLSFSLIFKNQNLGKFHVNLLGRHNIQNVLPCIAVAYELGMNSSEIKFALAKIVPMEKTMQPFTNLKRVTLIDDTYNANPDAAIVACEYMKVYKGKKVYVLQPMIELGKHAGQDHYRVAKIVSGIANVFFVTNGNFLKDIKKGVGEGSRNCVLQVATPKAISDYILKNCKVGDVAVFEGKESAFPLNLLDKDPVHSI